MNHKATCKTNKEDAPLNHFRRILANAGWLTGCRVLGDLANLILFIVLARTFGPSGIGQYAYALGIASLVYAAANLGLEDYAVRQCARATSEEKGALVGRLLLIQVVALLAAGILLLLFLACFDHTLTGVILVMSLVFQQAFFAFVRTLFSPSFSVQKMAGPAIAEFITRLIGIGGSLVLVTVFNTVLAVSLMPLAVSGLLLFLYAVRSCLSECKVIVFSVRWVEIRPILADGWPFAGSLFLSIMALRGNFIILSLMIGDVETGIYASAIKLMEAAVIPLGFLGFSAFPRLSHLYHSNDEEFWNAGKRLIQIAIIAGVLISWVLFFVAPYIVEPMFGQKFAGSGPTVRSIAGLGLLISLDFILVRLLFASDRQHTRLKIQAIMVSILLLSSIVAIPFYGIYGAVFGLYISISVNILLIFLSLGMTFMRRTERVMVTLFGTLSVVLVITYVTEMLAGSPIWNAFVSLATFIIVALWFRLLPRNGHELISMLR